jgi:predicted O-methyltransferase YrrM
MSYHNWFHAAFNKKHKFSSPEQILEEIFLMLEYRGGEYLKHNYEFYKELYINPDDDILSSKPQIIQQVREELYDFLKVLLENDVNKVLQIGLGHFGSTQFCLSFICDEVVTVDFDIKNISNYCDREILYNQNIEKFIHGDSTNENIISEVKKYGTFDCVFIDGNHSYDFVKKDNENYSKLVRDGGIVAFHDAFLEGDRYGTPRVLRELNKDINYIKHSKEVGIAYYINNEI